MTGRERQKGRTRKALLAAAARLIADGRTPSVTEVADAAEISRRTAYRYFPTQEQLLVAAAVEGLRLGLVAPSDEDVIPAPEPDTPLTDVEARLDRTVIALQRGAIANEQLFRTMIRVTVGRPSPTTPAEHTEPRRGARRIDWIELALEPVRKQLGKHRFDRLVSALTVCLGIDSLIVLRDLRGLTGPEAETVSRWTARSLLRASLAEVSARPYPPDSPSPAI
jgi:AcrR family transcriptional regulator